METLYHSSNKTINTKLKIFNNEGVVCYMAFTFTKETLAYFWSKITGLVNTTKTDLDNRKVEKEEGKSLISDTEIERLGTLYNYDDSSIKTQIDELKSGKADISNVYTKTETDKQITDEIAKIVADAPEDFDTLKEMSDWIAGHENDATAMNSAIQTNTNNISNLQTNKANVSDLDNYIPKSEISVITNDEIDEILV